MTFGLTQLLMSAMAQRPFFVWCLLALVLLFIPTVAAAEERENDTAMTMKILHLRTELYKNFCPPPGSGMYDDDDAGSIIYETPINSCFNGASLFHHSVDWGDVDIYDEISPSLLLSSSSDDHDHPTPPPPPLLSLLTRRFYASDNSTCNDLVDTYELPLDECLGPFGKPHPWGRFSLVVDVANSANDEDDSKTTDMMVSE
jgi:hypothetical protein